MVKKITKKSDRRTVRFGKISSLLANAAYSSGCTESEIIRTATAHFLARNKTRAAIIKAVITSAVEAA